jgi:hypothetical protein
MFCPIVTAYVLNQFRGHWLLSDALNVTIAMNLKLKKEFGTLLN